MAGERIEDVLEDALDELARVEHERWAHWQRYVHAQCERLSDGSMVIPADLAARWERQIATSFDDLDEDERESDREQVRRYLPIIAARLRGWIGRKDRGASAPAADDDNDEGS